MRNQSRSQITGRKGERWFSAQLPPEWSIQRPFDDFGLDGIVAIGSDSKMLPLEFGVQIKSSRRIKCSGDYIAAPSVSGDMLKYWLGRFSPTLLVVYDAQLQVGYFEWVQNLVTNAEAAENRSKYRLKIDSSRELNNGSWLKIKSELENYERDFRDVLRLKADVLPVCRKLSIAISLLCGFELNETSTRSGLVKHVTDIAWTYIAVAHEIDILLLTMAPNDYAGRTLFAFRRTYGALCRDIYYDFDQMVSLWGKEPVWIMMKKPNECSRTRKQLNAMVSECLEVLMRCT